MINPCNDIELCRWRSAIRNQHRELDELTAQGRADALWIAYYRIRNAADEALERLNRIKWPNKETP